MLSGEEGLLEREERESRGENKKERVRSAHVVQERVGVSCSLA